MVRSLQLAGFTVLVLVASLAFVQARYSVNSQYGPANFQALVSHEAERPFQYRVLFPWAANLALRANLPFLRTPSDCFRLAEIAATFLLLLALRSWLGFFFRDRRALFVLPFAVFWPMIFIFVLPRNIPVLYPWDVPSVLVTTVGLILMRKKHWPVYYAVFLIGTFNRETTCFLTIIYLLTALGQERLRTVVAHCSAQFIIWLAVKSIVGYLYAANHGPDLYEKGFWGNMVVLLFAQHYPLLLSILGYMWIPVAIHPRLVGDPFLRRGLFVVFPFLFGMFLVGNLNEIRIYGELIPLILPAFFMVTHRSAIDLRNQARQPRTRNNVAKMSVNLLPYLTIIGFAVWNVAGFFGTIAE